MNDALLLIAGFAGGLAAASALAAYVVRDLRSRRDAWQANYHAECKRHAAHELAQAQGREALAAANIVQLSGALLDATAQARKPVAIGGDVSARFCRN